jgi:hypothetical protein
MHNRLILMLVALAFCAVTDPAAAQGTSKKGAKAPKQSCADYCASRTDIVGAGKMVCIQRCQADRAAKQR